jgi:arylsulfatase A
MKSTVILSTMGAAILASASCTQQKSSQPNIIYILADDLGYGDLGCYGQEIIQTPHIDALAAKGMMFTQHYAGSTVSAPSRSALLTDLHTGHTFIRGNREHEPEGQFPLPGDTYTIPKMLQEVGYVTGAFGKWGLGYPGSEGDPNNQGFDEFFGYNCQRLAHHYYPDHLYHNQEKIILEGNQGFKKEQYAQDIIQEKALQFIRDNADNKFFMFVPTLLPHADLDGPKDSIYQMYRSTIEEVRSYQGVDSGDRYKQGPYGSSEYPRADFAAMVTRMDEHVGQIVAELRRLGIEDNTLIIFTSDNGPHREGGADPDFFKSYGPLRGVKRDLFEGGIRVPMIASWPGTIKPGSVSDHISAFWDMKPTFHELSGSKAQIETDGISIVPTLLSKKNQKEHEYLYWEFHEQGGRIAVRKGDWKGVKLNYARRPNAKMQLFNLSTDLREENNIADQHPEVVAELERIMKEAHVPSEFFNFGLPTIVE